MPTFGERLSELRKEKGLSQSELGKLFKLGQSTIGMYETNKREPDVTTIKKFSDYFNVGLDYIMGRTNVREYNKDPDEPTPAEVEDVIRKADLQFNGAPLDEYDKEDIIEFIKVVLKRSKKRDRQRRQATD